MHWQYSGKQHLQSKQCRTISYTNIRIFHAILYDISMANSPNKETKHIQVESLNIQSIAYQRNAKKYLDGNL